MPKCLIMKNQGSFWKSYRWPLLLSLAIHVLFLFSKIDQFLLNDKSASNKESERKIKVVFETKREKSDGRKGDKQNVIDKSKLQIVNTEKTGKEIEPVDSRFLGEKNQSFARQTIAKKVASFKEAGKGQRNGDQSKSVVTDIPKSDSGKSKGQNNRPDKLSLADFAPTANDHILSETKSKKKEASALGLENGALGKTGLAQSSDYVEDLPLGDVANLNTVEFKYFGFYDRIRRKLEQYWGNSLREKADILYKSGRRLPASMTKITSLLITIDNQGNIIHVLVKSTSGVQELDDAAIDSFNKAGPFPNPPRGMLIDGVAKIEWGFVVKG